MCDLFKFLMSQYTGAPTDPVHEFLEWRFHASDLYDSLTMHVLPSPVLI